MVVKKRYSDLLGLFPDLQKNTPYKVDRILCDVCMNVAKWIFRVLTHYNTPANLTGSCQIFSNSDERLEVVQEDKLGSFVQSTWRGAP